MLVARVLNQVAPPQVAPLGPVDFAAGTLKDDDVTDRFDVRVFQRFVDVFLQWDTASGENPPKMTEWIAPIRAQASMATAASGTIGI